MKLLWLLGLLLLPAPLWAGTQVNSPRVETGPIVDGKGTDEVWKSTLPVLITDRTSNETILLRSVHTDDRVFFLVQYPDKAENRLHEPWIWNESERKYVEGPHREDTFVFKWNMMSKDVNLSNFSDDDYRADVWYWKANRSDPVGHADDKMQILSSTPGEKMANGGEANEAKKLISFTGKERYLRRISDSGQGTYRKLQAPQQKTDQVINRFLPLQPVGSRADVKARGEWSNGFWFIEFSRKLRTGHDDDCQFSIGKPILFGVSIFSLYGNELDRTSPNFYGMGRISEPLRLHLLE